MRVEDLTTFEGECPIIVVFSAYMDIRIPLTKKWKKIINEKEDKPNTYHNNLIDYISEQIALSGFNMKSIGNLLIKKIVFSENYYYRYNDVGGFPATINDDDNDNVFYYCNGIESFQQLAEYGMREFIVTYCWSFF